MALGTLSFGATHITQNDPMQYSAEVLLLSELGSTQPKSFSREIRY